MADGTSLNPCQVDAGVTLLVVDVAREIPVQVSAASGDGRVWCFGDEPATLLVDVLEKEGYIIPTSIPTPYVQRVLVSGPGSNGGMVEIRKVVVETVDNNRTCLNFSRMVPSGWLAADGQCKTECEETNSSHE